MKIAIIGAGFAGLVSARTFKQFGHDVVVFEIAPEVGGVWSCIRRYPGVKTQNSKETYSLSTLKMPSKLDTHPKGEEVQEYLEAYVEQEKLRGDIRLLTKVVAALPIAEGWTIKTLNVETGEEKSEDFAHLCVCSGAFSAGNIPGWPGKDEFEAAGGKVLHTSDLRSMDQVAGKDVCVVGYGKSSCDATTQIYPHAATTHIVVRSPIWKLPSYLMGTVHYSYLLLTRFGEALFQYIEPWTSQKFLAGPGWPIRASAMGTLGLITRNQLGLKKANLLPPGPFETIARATISLATPGFYEAVHEGKIKVHREVGVESLSPGKVHLTDGATVKADVVVCGTGFIQKAPFLPEAMQRQLVDGSGNWVLYRHILPAANIPNLSFNGYNSSLFCPLTAEVTSLWIAAHLSGLLEVPELDERRRLAEEKVAWMVERTNGKCANATNLVPFSLCNIDEMMADLNLKLGSFAWFKQWLLPVDPQAYAPLTGQLLKRLRKD